MIRALFYVFLPLALLGDLRILLFVMNRLVFGAHKKEETPWRWLIVVLAPLLLFLTALFWPLSMWIDRLATMRVVDFLTPERIEKAMVSIALAKLGAAWLIVAASIGLFWLVDRIRVLSLAETPLAGTRTLPSEIIPLRSPHIPFAFLRRLGAHNDVYDIEVTRHEVFIDDLAPEFDEYRIAFLTDTHVASFMRRAFYRRCVEEVAKFAPDLVLLGGDFVTWKRHIPLLGDRLLDGLTARDGVFAVRGNHDYWAGIEQIESTMSRAGVQFLTNKNVTIRRGTSHLSLIGIDEVYRGNPDPAAAFNGLEPGPCITVSHHPDIIESIADRRVDLLLCGHTHGGQIRLPFFGAMVVPSKHEALYASGFHRLRSVLMYVSRGLGAVPPVRILCRPEVATFTLRRGSRTTT